MSPLNVAFPAGPVADRSGVVDDEVRLDGAALEAKVAALAGGLARRGARRGVAVAWQLPNWHEAVLLFHACWRIGAVAVPLPHRLGAVEVGAAVEETDPVVTFAAAGLPLGEVPGCITVRSAGFADLLESPAAPPRYVHPADVAVVLFTSGSTGTPKGVLHTHRALTYKAFAHARVHGLGRGDAVLMPAPLGHVSGLLNGVLLPAAAGLKVVLMAAWDPSRALSLIERERVSYLGGASTFLTALTASADFASERVTSLRVVSMGGSAMTPSAIAELGGALGCTVKRTYGCTEAPTVTTLHVGDPPEKGAETDGRPVGEAQVMVVDPGSLTPVGPDEPGEVWLRGPELFAGYTDRAANDAAIHRGWFRTGDLGRVDAEGWLTIVGRIKELVIRGGENIATAEVETVLEAHPSVTQAVVVGYPDRVLGERVAAVVVADEHFDLDACRRWFAQRGVARFKTPELLVRVNAIPCTYTGKPDRAALRERVAAEGGPWT